MKRLNKWPLRELRQFFDIGQTILHIMDSSYWIGLKLSMRMTVYLSVHIMICKKSDEIRWRQVFPITIVDDIPDNHFVYACTVEHVMITNRRYIRNIFSYNAI